MTTLGRAATGYHNASLGTTGVAVAFPAGMNTACISVGAGCFFGVRGSVTLDTFDDAHYGSILNGQPYYVTRNDVAGSSQGWIHLAPWTGTSSVAIAFG